MGDWVKGDIVQEQEQEHLGGQHEGEHDEYLDDAADTEHLPGGRQGGVPGV